MAWIDLGLIFEVGGQADWMQSHGSVPTALELPDRIRIFTAFRDAGNIGRMGFVDVARDNPTHVLGYASKPVLDVGPPGAFDEHGVTPLSAHHVGGEIWVHYAGWQRSEQVRYLLFMGLAVSSDQGQSFRRHSRAPVLDRTDQHYLVRTGFPILEGDRWRAWIAQSVGLLDLGGKPTPTYALGYMESSDGVHWPDQAQECFGTTADEIFGYGRSAVWRDGELLRGLFSVRRRESGYTIEYSTSHDGKAWRPLSRGGMAFLPSHTSPEQRETMFPSLIRSGDRTLMFYNGDGFGLDGIRAAVWTA